MQNTLNAKQNTLTAGTGIGMTNDVISVDGVKDQQNTSTAIKTWTGTKAQYDAIATKDNDTIYTITDDANLTTPLLEALYPVGSVYIGTMAVCPLAALFGTWTLVAANRVLQGSGNYNAGSTIEAGLPNITGGLSIGNISGVSYPYAITGASGALPEREFQPAQRLSASAHSAPDPLHAL